MDYEDSKGKDDSSCSTDRTIGTEGDSKPRGIDHGLTSPRGRKAYGFETSHIGAAGEFTLTARVPHYASAPKRQKLDFDEKNPNQRRRRDDLWSHYDERPPGSPLLGSSEGQRCSDSLLLTPRTRRHLSQQLSRTLDDSLPSARDGIRDTIVRQSERVEMLRNEVAKRASAARESLQRRMAVERQYREFKIQELLRRSEYPEEEPSVQRRTRINTDPRSSNSNIMRHDEDWRRSAAAQPSRFLTTRQIAGRFADHERPVLPDDGVSSAQIHGSPEAPSRVPTAPRLAPGDGMQLFLPADRSVLSDYQILIRQSIEYFEAQSSDLISTIPGIRKHAEVGQVGIRCRYCAHRPMHWRGRKAVYFPGCLAFIYQSAQNLASDHVLESCEDVPKDVKERFVAAAKKQKREARRSGGKAYWSESSRRVGLEEREGRGIWFKR